jgi:UDP-GlcNAc:undecaprenyl-phosphate GlcNAc-1-phosphate transferase
MNPFFQLTLAVAVSMMIIPLVRRFAPRLGLVDMPEERKVHTVPIPRVGGWGITLGTLAPLILVFKLDPMLQSFIVGCLILFVFGIWDDARSISHWPKFLGQLAAVALVVYYGDVWVSRVPFFDSPLPPEVGKPFTMFALVGVINAINHSDGLDGLAGGESVLSLMALAILGYMSGNALIVGISLATIGGIFGFLRYNSHPAYVFMGDSGSQVLGFTLGFLVVYLTQTANTAISAALPLLILGLPLADILSVLWQRARGGMNWFKATRNHVHHRLLELGFDHSESVVLIYLIQAALVVSAVTLRYDSDVTVTVFYVLGICGLFGALIAAEGRGWRVPRNRGVSSSAIAALKAAKVMVNGPLLVITVLTPVLMVLSALWVARIPSDFALAAGVLAVLPVTQLLWPRAVRQSMARLAIYGAAIFPAYLLINSPDAVPPGVQVFITSAIVVLALAIVLYVRFSTEQRFGTTPTDYLVVCGVVTLTVFGSIEVNSRAVVEAVLFATVVSYGCEIIVGSTPESIGRRVLQFSTVGTLLIISLRGALA